MIASDQGVLLAEQYQLPMRDTLGDWVWALEYSGGRFQLLTQQFKPFILDYSDPSWQYLRRNILQCPPGIVTAVGKPIHNKVIWDLTLGWGRDAFILTHLGAKVTGVEQHIAVYLLVKQALNHWPYQCAPFSIQHSDALTWVQQKKDQPDVIYLDPMFEQKRAAKAKKPMQILQEVTQNTMDSTALVSSAITYAPRVVCKVDHRQRQWHRANQQGYS